MNSIANNNFCSGCGACSAVCPKECISLADNEFGEIRPIIDADLCVNCGKCNRVCPFNLENSKPNNKTSKETYYIGNSKEFSYNASSGGVATFILNSMLEKRIADYIVAVSPQNDSNELFAYSICSNKNDLILCQGSAYYPVTLAKILSQIKHLDGSFAIIGVPCFISAMKNLKEQSTFLNNKIKYLVGIVCGHTPTKLMIDCLAWKSGHKRSDITSCRFRIKDNTRPAWDYGVKLEFSDESYITSFGSEDFGFLFWRKLFTQECCNNCKDVFADNADITFMDAWLDDYKNKTNGTSLIICRNAELDNILKELVLSGELTETDKSKPILAQKKLVEYKKISGSHKKEELLRKKVQKICYDYKASKDIIDRLKRLCYKEGLKKSNKILWLLAELKERLKINENRVSNNL